MKVLNASSLGTSLGTLICHAMSRDQTFSLVIAKKLEILINLLFGVFLVSLLNFKVNVIRNFYAMTCLSDLLT